MPAVTCKMMKQNTDSYKIFMRSDFIIFHFNFLMQVDPADITVSSWHMKHLISALLSHCFSVWLILLFDYISALTEPHGLAFFRGLALVSSAVTKWILCGASAAAWPHTNLGHKQKQEHVTSKTNYRSSCGQIPWQVKEGMVWNWF